MDFLTEEQIELLSTEEKQEYLNILKKLERAQKYNKLHYFEPYPFQKLFYDKGADNSVRALIAANRCGKTYSAVMEVAMHLTGRYPDWWEGKRWDKPIQAVAAGVTAPQVRDVLQLELLGTKSYKLESEIGSGAIPRDAVDMDLSTKGRDGALTEIFVKHTSGGHSAVKFFAYSQGFEPMQGFTADIAFIDEQCPDEVFSELVKRTSTVDGLVLMTFTPLQGITHLVKQFWEEDGAFRSGMVNAGWDDVTHLSEKARSDMLAATPKHLVKAVTQGIPVLGEGAVFNVAEEDIKFRDVEIRDNWPRLCGLDIGFTNDPTAAILTALDPTTNTIYIYDEYGEENNNTFGPSDHVPHLFRKKCNIIPVAYDSAANAKTGASGMAVADMYREMGINMLPSSFKNPKAMRQMHASYKAILPGLVKMEELMKAGKLKVHADCKNFWREFRKYSYDDKGRPSEIDNHWMDAARYSVMSIIQDHGEPLIGTGNSFDTFYSGDDFHFQSY